MKIVLTENCVEHSANFIIYKRDGDLAIFLLCVQMRSYHRKNLLKKLGVSHRHLGDLERGSSNGSVKILIDIAEYFHVSMDHLLLSRDSSRDQFQNELQAAIDHLEKIKGLL